MNAILNHATIGHNSTAPWSSGHIQLEPYAPTDTIDEIVDEIVSVHRSRQAVIRAKTRISLQYQAAARSMLCRDEDFEEDKDSTKITAFGRAKRKLTTAAGKRVDAALTAALAEIKAGEIESQLAASILPYIEAMEPFDRQNREYEKHLTKLVKRLPVYPWVKGVKGFGDVSFATIVGECGDIGTYKSVSAVWKRLGLAVMSGNRQGAPGEGASAQDWIDHGYNRARRSVSWNARNQIIGGMGKWRPVFGEDVHVNPDLTPYQRVYAERARYEAEKLGLPVTESDKGKESYKLHIANRAHRYTEKRMLKHLWIEWRRAPAQAA